MIVKESDIFEQKMNASIARAYKWLIDEDYLEDIDDFELLHVAKGGYIHDYGFEGVDEGYKPYYDYLKKDLEERKNNIHEEYNNNEQLIEIDNGGEYNMILELVNAAKSAGFLNLIENEIRDISKIHARSYKYNIDKDHLEDIDDNILKDVAEGGYINDYGFEGVDEGYKPYYEYLKQDLENRKNNIYEEESQEYNEQQLLLEDNNYNNTNIVQYEYNNTYYPQYVQPQYNYSYDYNNYYTPYSYEYDPYIDYYNNTYYNDTVNTTVDLTNNDTFNDSITNVLDMIKSYKDTVNIFKPKHIKKKIINYISNYRPVYNKDKGIIEPVLIE